MKKEFVNTELKNLMFKDSVNFVGKKDVVLALKRAFEDAMEAARRTINKMLDSNSRYRCYDDSQLKRLHEHYIRLAEVDFKWRSNENNIGQLILVWYTVSEIVGRVKELKEAIEKEIEDKKNKEWDNWEEEYDD